MELLYMNLSPLHFKLQCLHKHFTESFRFFNPTPNVESCRNRNPIEVASENNRDCWLVHSTLIHNKNSRKTTTQKVFLPSASVRE